MSQDKQKPDLKIVNLGVNPSVESISAEINKHVGHLNQLMGIAATAGLKVELEWLEERQMGNRHPYPTMKVELFKRVL